jgi:hypothetical protein
MLDSISRQSPRYSSWGPIISRRWYPLIIAHGLPDRFAYNGAEPDHQDINQVMPKIALVPPWIVNLPQKIGHLCYVGLRYFHSFFPSQRTIEVYHGILNAFALDLAEPTDYWPQNDSFETVVQREQMYLKIPG